MAAIAVAQPGEADRPLAIRAPVVVGGLTAIAFALRLLLMRDSLQATS